MANITYTASQVESLLAESAYTQGVNTGASIGNVPTDKRTVVCGDIDTTAQQTFALGSEMSDGRELHVLGKATADAKIAFTSDDTHVVLTTSPLEVPSGKHYEINVLYAGGVHYVRAVTQD